MRSYRSASWGVGLFCLALVVAACAKQSPVPAPAANRSGLAESADKQALSQLALATNSETRLWAKQGELGPGVPAFWIRPGYKCELAAEDFGEARFLQLDDHGILYVSQPKAGTIAMLRLGADGKYEKIGNFVEGMPSVHGMQWKDGYLWFTESGSIYKAKTGTAKANVETIIPNGKLPSGGHWWRSILVDDDGFYTSIGDSGNINDHTGDDREKIWRYSLDGQSRTLFASGLRNTEKLLHRPGTLEVWGMDHGSDWYGKSFGDKEGRQPITDEVPGEKFNHYVQGGFYGHPFFVAGLVPRPEYANKPDLIDWAEKVVMPALSFGAHWAPDGWCFYTGDAIPGAKGDAFMTFHGSWNRLRKQGYRVERTLFDQVTGQPYGHYILVGTLSAAANETLARPVDVIQAPDGSLLWSDDQANKIYRLTYVGPR